MEVKVRINGRVYTGLVKGVKLAFPVVWVRELDMSITYSKEAIERGLNGKVLIG